MMPTVEFLVAGSPNAAFFSQIAASRAAVFARNWKRWQPTFKCILGGEPDWHAVQNWMPQLSDIDIEFLSIQRFKADSYFAQAERRLNRAACGVDAFVLLDADTFLMGEVEDVLDIVADGRTIAGVQAHYGFPTPDGTATVADWNDLAQMHLDRPMRFDHAYSLAPEDVPHDKRRSPFYVNAGAIIISSEIVHSFYDVYRRFRRGVESSLAYPYFAGQVAVALAVEHLALHPISLPMRYNFPNDPIADARYPEELADVRILHFLRTNLFDRGEIFSDAQSYRNFLGLRLEGSNRVFQDGVRRILGEDYPFGKPADPLLTARM